MIFGIGVDLVHIPRVERGLERYGERYSRRILSAREYGDLGLQTTRPARFVASRFAAKEAFAKALGTGFRDGLWLRDISVTHDKLGKPWIETQGRASALLRERGIGATHLSLSDEFDYALAFVTLERV
ncbi:MAG: holo-ACP synthase [Gammaproteobacteria bacterium]